MKGIEGAETYAYGVSAVDVRVIQQLVADRELLPPCASVDEKVCVASTNRDDQVRS